MKATKYIVAFKKADKHGGKIRYLCQEFVGYNIPEWGDDFTKAKLYDTVNEAEIELRHFDPWVRKASKILSVTLFLEDF